MPDHRRLSVCCHRSPRNYDRTRWSECVKLLNHDGDHEDSDGRTWTDRTMPCSPPGRQSGTSTGDSIVLVGGPFDQEMTTVPYVGAATHIVAPFGRDGHAFYRIVDRADPMRAEFEGFAHA